MIKRFYILLLAIVASVGMSWALTPLSGDAWDESSKTLTVNANPGKNAYKDNTEIEHVIINNGVTSIGNAAFYGCSSLTSVTLPSGLTTIGNDAFRETSLASVSLPSGLISIGNNAFNQCTSLASVTFPEGLATIDVGAFSGCSSLTSVTLPESLTTVNVGVFSGCTSLASVTILAPSLSTYGKSVFYNTASGLKIYVPAASVDTYKAGWSTYADKITAIYAAPAKLPGAFTINANGDKIVFSRGNLQAKTTDLGANWTWDFAPNQWSLIGNAVANNAINGNKTVSANGTVDLFGWSTAATYYGINPSWKNDDYTGDFVDWGALMGTEWRTLSRAEFYYIVYSRTQAAYKRGQATVNGVPGYVLLPDAWTLPDGLSFTNSAGNYTTNQYDGADWTAMESAGAVFLPAAGVREGTDIYQVNLYGWYWASTPNETDGGKAYYLWFDKSSQGITEYNRWKSKSVRLVTEAPIPPYEAAIKLINEIPNPVVFTAACKAKIDAARTAFDALSDGEKAQVTNYTTLTTAEAAWAALIPDPVVLPTVKYAVCNLPDGWAVTANGDAVLPINGRYHIADGQTVVLTPPASTEVGSITSAEEAGLLGAGTAEDPYLIYTVANWNAVAAKVNDGTQAAPNCRQMANLDGVTTVMGNSESKPFKGIYDGNGFVFTNINLSITSGSNPLGLFGCVNDASAVVKNVVVAGGTVSSTSQNVGAIVGQLNGGTVQYCANYATVSSSYNGKVRMGGIVGWMRSAGGDNNRVDHCINYGNVSGIGYVGGITGSYGAGNVNYCQNYGSISSSGTDNATSGSAGGIIGWDAANDATKITYNHNGGNITLTQGHTYNPSRYIIANTNSSTAQSISVIVPNSNSYLSSLTLTIGSTNYTGADLATHEPNAQALAINPEGITISGITYAYGVAAPIAPAPGTNPGTDPAQQSNKTWQFTMPSHNVGLTVIIYPAEVIAKINAIPQPVTLKLATRDSIESARAAYDALTAEQKLLVPAADLQKLTDAEAELATLNPGGGAPLPEGALTGAFSINADGDKIAFSKGNLQATTANLGETWTWAFAANQYDYVGNAVANTAITGNKTVSTNGTIDLFGWSTAATYYGINNSNISGKHPGDFVDWGETIAEGWRTLTRDEWNYLFETRTDAASKYGHATVAGIHGIIVLPDSYKGTAINADHSDWSNNIISAEDWAAYEANGVAFLPAAGSRLATSVSYVGEYAFYWTSTTYYEKYAYRVRFVPNLSPDYGDRVPGQSVRLVTAHTGSPTPLDSAQAVKDLIEAIPMPVTLEDACVNAVQAARDAYNALTDATKGALDDATVQKLNQAITDYTALIQAGADAVTAKIAAIPQPVTLKLATGDSIQNARAAYDALTADQKLLVSNYDVLEAAEATWAGLINAAPAGALSGKYTINAEGDVIYFAHGNLQYTRENLDADWSTGTFRLATNQYDLIEVKTYPAAYCTDNYGDKTAVGLFGWGTWGEGKTPNLTSSDRTLYTWSTDFSGTLEGTSTWRTLTKDEWVYLLAHNNQSYATVHGVNGLLVAPDGKDIDGKSMADWVVINDETWTTMQNDGYLFLPACGQRSQLSSSANITTGEQGEDVVYYSSTQYSDVYAYNIWYTPGQDPAADDHSNKRQAFGIRLVSAGVNPLDQAQAVKDLIDAIPVPVTLDDACVNAIQAARAGFDALDNDAKAILDAADVKKLTDAEQALKDLNQAEADKVIAKINNIPLPVELKLATRDSIESARAAYDALNAAQQALVTNYQKLLDAEDALAALNPGGGMPAGALSGKFTINEDGDQISFAKGNLQATTANLGETWTWGFAANQWDLIGNAAANNAVNGKGTVSENGTVDLFGWSTLTTYYGIHNSTNSDYYSGDFKEWGENITGATWKTLRPSDWIYIISNRADAAQKQGQATVNGVNGYIFLPDEWELPSGLSFTAKPNNWTANVYDGDDWTAMENAGAVFLPKSPWRSGNTVATLTAGYYWSSDYNSYSQAMAYSFQEDASIKGTGINRFAGIPVRLVTADAGSASPLDSAQAVKDLIDAIPTPVEYPTSGPAIAAALVAYQQLSDAAKGALDEADVQKMTDAAAQYTALDAIAAIDAIPAEIVYDPLVKAAIETAREKYDALIDASKALVPEDKVDKLTNAEQAWAILVAKIEHNVSYIGKDGELKNETVALLHIPDPAPEFNGYEFVRWDVKAGDFLEEGLRVKAVYTPIITTNPAPYDTLVYNGLAQTLIVAAEAKEGHVEYSFDAQDAQSWQTELPKATNAGLYAIYYKLVREGHEDYIAPEPVIAEIAKAPVAYTAPTAYDTLVYTASNQTLIAAGQTNDGTFEYSLNPTLLDSWKAELPQAKDAGTYSVYYRVQGDLNHLDSVAATPVAVTIAKAALTATADDKNVIYGDAVPAYTVTYAGWQGNDDASVLTGNIAFACEYASTSNVGEYTITPSGVDAANYTITFVNGKVTVAKAESGCIAPVAFDTLVYNGANQTLIIAGQPMGGTMYYSLTGAAESWQTALPEAKEAGTYNVYYRVKGDGNHNDHDYDQPVAVTIAKAALTATADDKTVIYGDPIPAYSVTYAGWHGTDDASVLTGTIAYACTYAPLSNVGDYTITPSGVDAANYAIQFINGTLTVNKAKVAYVAPVANELTYTAADQTLITAGTTNDGQFVYRLGVQGEYDGELPQATHVGTYEVYYKVLGDGNHLDSIIATPVTVSIAKAALTATADNKTVIFGENIPTYTVTYTGWLGQDKDTVLTGTIAFACEYVKGSQVGEYTITPSGVDAADYAITFVNGTLTVNRKSAKSDDITAKQADNEKLVYDAEANKPTIIVKDTTLVLTENTDYKLTFIGRGNTEYAESAIAPAHVGEYTAIVAFIGNYKDTLTVDFVINKAPLTITADNKEVTFGEYAPEFTVSYEGWQGTDTATVLTGVQAYACAYVRGNNVGDYTIIPSGVDAHDYAITFVNGTLTVNRKSAKDADIAAKQADNEVLVYDAEVNRPTIIVKDTTLVLTEAQDYVLTFKGVAADQSIYAESETAPTHVGNYTAIVAFIGNYIDTLTVDFTINKAPLTITAENKEMIYGDVAPEFTVSYAGWFGNDDKSVLLGTQAYDCVYAPGSPIGTYVITPKGVDAYDYAITFVDGTLTVNKAHVYVSGAEAHNAKFADGHAIADVTNQGVLNGIKLNDPIAHVTTAAFSSADVAEHLTITLFYELTGDAALLNNYNLDPTSEIFTTEGVIIEPFIPDDEHQPEEEEQVEVQEGIDVYAYGYCDGSAYSLKYHLNSGNPDQYKIDFDDARFTDVAWTNLTTVGKDGTIDIDIPVDMPTGDYSMTVYFRDSRFTWLESKALNVTFHVNLPETYVRPLFDNVIALVDTCRCLTDIQWYWRANSSDPWQPIPGANGYYYHSEGKLTGEYFVSAKMNGVPTYTCGQADMETLYGDKTKKQAQVKAYPNPVQDKTNVTIEGSTEWVHNLRIVSLMGVEMDNMTFEGDETIVDMNAYPQGNYMISVDGIVVKVMKK